MVRFVHSVVSWTTVHVIGEQLLGRDTLDRVTLGQFGEVATLVTHTEDIGARIEPFDRDHSILWIPVFGEETVPVKEVFRDRHQP